MIAAVLSLLAGFVLTAAIIAANGYFVAQEFTYMSVDRTELRAMAAKGDKSAERALAVTGRTSFMLSGAQLGITVTGLMVGYVAEPFIGESSATLLGGVGVPIAVGLSVGTVMALVGATVVQMIFGELFPKNLAIANPAPLARALARSTLMYMSVFGWLITFFDKSSNAMLRLLRVEPVHDVDSSATAEDLERIIEDSRASGDLPIELSLLLDRVLDFPDRDVEHAMIPRVRVDILDGDTPIRDARIRMARAHTRYPVLGEHEEPVGVVHLIDVLSAPRDDVRPVSSIMLPALVVPNLMPLPDALHELTRTRNQLACVIDEYGGFVGVLTIEDLAEEVVGEITDEHDPSGSPDIDRNPDGTWIMSGEMHVDEVERIIGNDLLPRGDYETLAGLLIAEQGSLPDLGDVVRVDLLVHSADLVDDVPTRRFLLVEVTEVERHVPTQLRVRLADDATDGVDPAATEPEANR